MKTLTVPLLETLDACHLSAAADILKHHARHETIDALNWPATFPGKPLAAFDIARGAAELYLRYSLHGPSLRALSAHDGEHVHTDSCVEFFMRRNGEMNYLNFEFNCIGTCYAERHRTRTDSTPLTPGEYRRIRRHTSLPPTPFAEKKGIHAWQLTLAIPFDLMNLDPDALPEKIFGNFCICADETQHPHYLTWNPVDLPRPDYHCPEFFGEIHFQPA
ncbi:MAG: hypothetical protein LBJ23_06785 [Tannerella sp.]|jgi:hypothetical protein|nr:hypothetical protein [Tannerella sp.]